ncbi:MAG: heat-inducible transcriptional repressor HrcA [Anaerolineae bacterium]
MSDATNPLSAELTARQEHILGLIVREFISSAAPVSSKQLVDDYSLNVSSATVRNEMARLEALGLIYAPHTSAGRVPTEAGYRYFVQHLSSDSELPLDERRMIRHQFHQARHDVEQWLRLAASVLARTVQGASLVTPPHAETNRLQHLELIHTQGRLVLMVLVLRGGDVRQEMLTLAEPVPQEALSQAAERINDVAAGLTAHEIHTKATQLPLLEREVAEVAADVIERADQLPTRHVYYHGLTEMLAAFKEESVGALQAVRLLEEHTFLDGILSEALGPNIGGVRVVIAGEGRWEELSHCSMVLSRYGVSDQATGALGVLGPVRMRYGRAVSTVRYVAGLMSDLLLDVYGEVNSETGPRNE